MELLEAEKERNLYLEYDEGKKWLIFYANILYFPGFNSIWVFPKIQRNHKFFLTVLL